MIKLNKFIAVILILLAILAPVAMMPSIVLGASAVVDLVLLPTTQNVNATGTFDISIQAQCNGQEVIGVDAFLNFDPAHLEVQAITLGTTLNPIVTPSFDNTLGKIDYSAGTLTSPYPSSTFTVATVRFKSRFVAASTSTNINFNTSTNPDASRRTDVVFGETSVLRNTTEAAVNIQATPIDVLRDLPAYVVKGQTFNVTVSFTAPTDNFNAIGLTDLVPAGWTAETNITWCNPAAMESRVNANTAEYIWAGPYTGGTAFTAVYKVTVPADAASGLYSFANGILMYYIGQTGPITSNISGDSQLEAGVYNIQGVTWEVKGVILGGVTLTLDSAGSVVSDAQGVYGLIAATTGQHTVVASKASFRTQTRTINVADVSTVYPLDFKANYGLVPNAPNLTYVLACVNKWKFPPEGLGLSLTKVLSVINAWKFPV